MATALVTGASAGLGRAFAFELARRGYDLVLVARSAERLAVCADELAAFGVRVETMAADLGCLAELETVSQRCETVDLLVNNAGFGVPEPLLGDANVHRQAIDVMCTAVLVLSAAAGRSMVARGGGHILNVASLSAFLTSGNYSPIKAWVKSYTEALALELADTPVTATAFCPGWIRTEFHERADISTRGIPGWLWVDATDAARWGVDAALARRVVAIPTGLWKMASFFLSKAPRPLIRAISGQLTKSRR